MAKCHQSISFGWLLPGLFASSLLFLVAILALGALWAHAPVSDWRDLWQDAYLWHVVRFTFYQAFLSTFFSVLPALLLARALIRRHFPGREWFLRLCAMTLVLPVLVALFGILSIYGRQGWIAQLLSWWGYDIQFSPYGLFGILLTHLFFNLPLATRLLLQALESIPVEQRQLTAQLGMSNWQKFRLMEWPYLRRQCFSSSALIFMLCFSSFATVLTLGGGPKATTIELAIYQALTYDYNLGHAALLALLQLCCCLTLVVLSQKLSGVLVVGNTYAASWQDPIDSWPQRLLDSSIIFIALLLLVPPLLAVVLNGINHSLNTALLQPKLWQSLLTSLKIALVTGLLAVILAIMLLWSSRELLLRQHPLLAQGMELSGMLILAMPGIVLATGFFLLLTDTIGPPQTGYLLVIFTNALMALPYALKVLENPMHDLTQRYHLLCLSLRIQGFSRLYFIEFKALKRPIAQAMAFATILSVGDFGIIALFGNEQFSTLPFYLYQQIGAYRSQYAAVSALLLLLFCFLLFLIIEQLPKRKMPHDYP